MKQIVKDIRAAEKAKIEQCSPNSIKKMSKIFIIFAAKLSSELGTPASSGEAMVDSQFRTSVYNF
jgi:hypothetical protein